MFYPPDDVYEVVEDCFLSDDLQSVCWFRERKHAESWAKKLNRKLAPRRFFVSVEDLSYVTSPCGKHYPET